MKKSVHVAAALAALLAPASLASAQSGPSVQEQMACVRTPENSAPNMSASRRR